MKPTPPALEAWHLTKPPGKSHPSFKPKTVKYQRRPSTSPLIPPAHKPPLTVVSRWEGNGSERGCPGQDADTLKRVGPTASEPLLLYLATKSLCALMPSGWKWEIRKTSKFHEEGSSLFCSNDFKAADSTMRSNQCQIRHNYTDEPQHVMLTRGSQAVATVPTVWFHLYEILN